MKRMARLAGFSLLGSVVAGVIYWLLAFGVLEAIRSRSGHSPESYLGVAFLVMMPVALFLGSGLTGYLSRPHLRTRFGLVSVTPGLYLSLVFLTLLLFYGIPNAIMGKFTFSPGLSNLLPNTTVTLFVPYLSIPITGGIMILNLIDYVFFNFKIKELGDSRAREKS